MTQTGFMLFEQPLMKPEEVLALALRQFFGVIECESERFVRFLAFPVVWNAQPASSTYHRTV